MSKIKFTEICHNKEVKLTIEINEWGDLDIVLIDDVDYTKSIIIDAEDIPKFINMINKLEKIMILK